MEKKQKPQNLYVLRKKWLTALGAVAWLLIAGLCFTVLVWFAYDYFVTNATTAELQIIDAVLIFIGCGYIGIMSFVLSVLCVRNLFFPYVLIADENGICDYSGFNHGGKLEWGDIYAISFADLWEASEGAWGVRIYLKDAKSFKRKKSLFWRIAFFFAMQGVTVKTFCSYATKKQILESLNALFGYYSSQDN